jgi:electron transport complex protein RnfG
MSADKKNILFFVRIIGVLLVITMCVAALLSLVNGITKDRIAENEAKEIQKAIGKLFPEYTDLSAENMNLELNDKTLNGFYEVKNGDETVGYYANVAPKGFKGPVNMLIGLKTDGSVCGIEIIASGETPGIGDKIKDKKFLNAVIGGNYDTISGATYSSRAVINGTKTAIAAY